MIFSMRGVFRPQRDLQDRIIKPPIDISQHIRIHVISVKPHLIIPTVSRGRLKRPPIASGYTALVLHRVEEGLIDLHASTLIAEVKRYGFVSPDILLGYCAWLRFDLDLVWTVVAPCGAVAPAYGALTDIDMFGQSWHCDCDGAAVTAGADWSAFSCHLSVCSYGIWVVRWDDVATQTCRRLPV